MKSKCYNVIVELLDNQKILLHYCIIAAACTCPTGSSIKCLRKWNHVGAIHFALEYFNRKTNKTNKITRRLNIIFVDKKYVVYILSYYIFDFPC